MKNVNKEEERIKDIYDIMKTCLFHWCPKEEKECCRISILRDNAKYNSQELSQTKEKCHATDLTSTKILRQDIYK